ncbi:PREDICTED: inositol polyphosphate 5-phosphatase OCRL-1-like [Priapulus caudatus]|uniref:Inositol polyphosphate 5-phosphatase OCRL-1-like n=1 Tax=Priapulus caudatus TaxID=37621 RepID=A0ABM1F4I6_PRICU|nr:PREDICTED: inositol polyphosphate 5-phosphatase OCRL-1-like [Priapulus caudatus]
MEMDLTQAVQQNLLNTDRCLVCVQVAELSTWAKTSRILALVHHQGEYGLFIFAIDKSPVATASDLSLKAVVGIDAAVVCDVSSPLGIVEADLEFKIVKHDCTYTFEMSIGQECNTFVAEFYRVLQSCHEQYGDGTLDFSWVKPYGGEEIRGSSQAQGNQPHSHVSLSKATGNSASTFYTFEDNFQTSVPDASLKKSSALPAMASGGNLRQKLEREVTPLLRHSSLDMMGSRDGIIKRVMETREDEYTDIQTFRVFTGTWNVNGQPASVALQAWLAGDDEPPDMYAVGFQELDLSKEAFLFNDSPREDEWLQAVTNALHRGATYTLVRTIRLVGMMLVTYVAEPLRERVIEVAAETVGTGIMGKMGNKGGVAVRFLLHNTSLCVVNAHLAAHTDDCERRNQDHADICERLRFARFDPPLPIWQHDVVLWIGDLNYRLDQLAYDQVMLLMEKGAFAKLLEYDQLYTQKKKGRAFKTYEEGPITFRPTYKFDPGSDTYDTSEKCRVPAWCDRVLWKGQHVKQLTYRSHPTLMISDHKPVSALFDVGVKVVDVVKFKRVYEELMKQLDKLENEYLPQVTLDTMEIDFDRVAFVEPAAQYLIVANTGQVPVEFEFIRKPNDAGYCKPWLSISPYKDYIMPGEKRDVKLEVYVKAAMAARLNAGDDRIDDILVLHLHGGKDIFVTVGGRYVPSCFGASLQALCSMPTPLREVPVAQLVDLGSPETPAAAAAADAPYDIPKEIWSMLNHLYEFGVQEGSLFQQPGLPSEILQIRDVLDTGIADSLPGSVHSVAEALLMFLEALPDPVVPYSHYQQCIDRSRDVTACEQLVAAFPPCHSNVFRYLMAFLRTVLYFVDRNKSDVMESLALMFGSILLRAPPGVEPTLPPRMLDNCKATFVTNFITE